MWDCASASCSSCLLTQPQSVALQPSQGCLEWKVVDSGELGWVRLLAVSGHLTLLPAVTPSDCYVSLWLPTASSHRLQTRTVKNSRNPIWNQSFRFRIHSQLKVGPGVSPCPAHCPCQPLLPAVAPLTFLSHSSFLQLLILFSSRMWCSCKSLTRIF